VALFQPTQTRRADAFARPARAASIRVPPNVWYLGLTSFLTDISSEMVASTLPAYLVLHLGFTPMAFGAIDGLYQGVTGVTRLLGGYLADRFRRYKEMAAIGYGLSALCKVFLLPASTVASIGAVIAVDRLGKGIRTAPRDAIIGLSVDRPRLGVAFGVHRALDTAGAALGPVVAFAVLSAAPRAFDAVFVLSFALAVAGLAAVLLLVRNPAAPPGDSSTRATLSEVFALGRSSRFWRLSFGAMALALTTISDGFLYLVLQRDLGLSPAGLPLMFAGTAFCYFLVAVPVGWAADRVGRRAIFLCGYVVLFAAYMSVLAPLSPGVRVGALVSLLGLYYGATDGVLAALASATLPSTLRGTGLGALTTSITLARLVGSVLFGYLWTTRTMTFAVLVFGAALVAALVVVTFLLRAMPDEGAA
jgi:MFS family permease